MGRASFAAAVERLAKSDPAIRVTSDFWNRDPWLLGTPGGAVDLRTGKIRPSSRSDGITKTTSVAPAIAACPLWLKFLDESTGGDKDLIRFLQQWCGYCLTGVTIEHALLFIFGPGGNGKSVFLKVITSIMKDYAVTCAMETFAASANDRHPTEVAKLQGARLVTASETEEGRAWAENRIKELTGGDRICARFMRQDEFEFVPQLKLTIVGNHKPTLHNVDVAARRRFYIVPFTRKPEKPDHLLEEKLVREAPAILQWMIEGCLDWRENRLIRPPEVAKATESYFSDQEIFPRWLEEACDAHPAGTASERSSVLYKSWADFARSVGAKAGTLASFKDKMTAAGFAHRRTNKGGEYVGINIRPDVDHNH
jgi:putative DNA primase/helicase